MKDLFQFFIRAIYPSLINFFIFTFATIFRNKQEIELIQAVSLLAAIIFFVFFFIGAVGHIALLLKKQQRQG